MAGLEKPKAALLGLGKVGKNLLRQYANQNHSFTINLIADSKHILTKRNRQAFSKNDVQKIVAIKDKVSSTSRVSYEIAIKGCRVYEFDKLKQELSAINDLVSGSIRNWVMLDTTLLGAEGDYRIARSLMGCVAYCTGNKAPWADYDLCFSLYNEAKRNRTQLGLNNTAGVWADQMEALPIVARALRRGRVEIWKRDNSSFNSFFCKVGQGVDFARAISQIAAAGHLEITGPNALSAEVKDQTYKARIAANICGILRNTTPKLAKKMDSRTSAVPKSLRPADIAAWHLDGRKLGKYPVLLTKIRMDEQELLFNVRFEQLSKEDPLSRRFLYKTAFSVRAHVNARFSWSSTPIRSRVRCYTNSDYGGAVKTAAKLLWEAERAISLSHIPKLEDDCFPMPILCALSVSRRDAKSLQMKLARSLR